jgi:hypothetical protein
LMIAVFLFITALSAKERTPAPDESSGGSRDAEPADDRNWIPVIRSTCGKCGAADERPGGRYRCAACGTPIPDQGHTQTGRSVLER